VGLNLARFTQVGEKAVYISLGGADEGDKGGRIARIGRAHQAGDPRIIRSGVTHASKE
jgi:hypothetical protein